MTLKQHNQAPTCVQQTKANWGQLRYHQTQILDAAAQLQLSEFVITENEQPTTIRLFDLMKGAEGKISYKFGIRLELDFLYSDISAVLIIQIVTKIN